MTPENRRRYKLHYILRKHGFRVNTKEKTVYVNHNNFDLKDIEVIDKKYINKLKNKFNYGIQLTL